MHTFGFEHFEEMRLTEHLAVNSRVVHHAADRQKQQHLTHFSASNQKYYTCQ